VISSPVLTSARRYIMFGVVRTSFLIYALRLGFWVGISPSTPKKWFDELRPHLSVELVDGRGFYGAATKAVWWVFQLRVLNFPGRENA
jgi:hypothetical protein